MRKIPIGLTVSVTKEKRMKSVRGDQAFTREVVATCVCPVCHGTLKISDQQINCEDCRRNFPLLDGIPNFSTESDLADKIRRLSEKYDKDSIKYQGSPKSCGYSSNKDYLARLNVLKKWLSSEQMRGKTVLDIGCGTGLMTEQWVPANEVWGVDISWGLLDVAKGKGLKTVLSSADRLPFHDRHFDVVLCVGVIPYYKKPERIFSEICRVTQAGGTMIVTSTANSILIRSVRFLKQILGFNSQLAHLYTEAEISAHLRTEGGEVLDACVAYKDKVRSTRGAHAGLKFRLFSRTAAVLARIPDG